jgi:hypothetical protein
VRRGSLGSHLRLHVRIGVQNVCCCFCLIHTLKSVASCIDCKCMCRCSHQLTEPPHC